MQNFYTIYAAFSDIFFFSKFKHYYQQHLRQYLEIFISFWTKFYQNLLLLYLQLFLDSFIFYYYLLTTLEQFLAVFMTILVIASILFFFSKVQNKVFLQFIERSSFEKYFRKFCSCLLINNLQNLFLQFFYFFQPIIELYFSKC